MLLTQYVVTKKGDSNGIFDVLTPELNHNEGRESYTQKVRELILASLRRDYEANMIGKFIPETNPSEDVSTVKFFYTPVMRKQAYYLNQTFPIPQSDGSQIEDAFVCLGSRFGLQTLQVWVDVYSDSFDSFWAVVYYIADMKTPACIIEARKVLVHIDDTWLRGLLEAENELRQRLIQQAERMEKEDAVVVE